MGMTNEVEISGEGGCMNVLSGSGSEINGLTRNFNEVVWI